ncbi:hypothetical protein DFH07DRAFT_1064942 [Mycena maculata]|uniref:Uncharacterized protein n=1 Tax=Mycena maculata TaxID=230809 RepID=A0AAD7I6B6_9AGAR|nr:hypothetical protein DFH07DRAFT_1064942 [Mycena maculata]
MSSKSDQTPLAAVLEELVSVGFFLQHAVAGTIAQTIFFSAYGIFFALALYSIFRKGLKSRAAIIMLLVVVYLYVASAAQWAMNAWVTLTKIHGFLMVDIPFPDRAELAEAAILKVVGVQEAIFDFNMAVGDSVVVWRTWAVYQHRAQRRILVILVPGALLLLTFIFSVIDTACSNYDGAAPLPGICYEAGWIAWGLSAATNLTCTIFIGLKARQHRKITRPLGKPSRMSGEKALSILFDSGFIYSLLWLSQVISFFASAQIITLTSPAVYLWGVISAMGNQMAGFYPTLVIVIVNLRRTIWEEEEELTRPLRWTPNAKRSGMTDTFGSQRGDDTVFDITSDKTFVDASKHPRV